MKTQLLYKKLSLPLLLTVISATGIGITPARSASLLGSQNTAMDANPEATLIADDWCKHRYPCERPSAPPSGELNEQPSKNPARNERELQQQLEQQQRQLEQQRELQQRELQQQLEQQQRQLEQQRELQQQPTAEPSSNAEPSSQN